METPPVGSNPRIWDFYKNQPKSTQAKKTEKTGQTVASNIQYTQVTGEMLEELKKKVTDIILKVAQQVNTSSYTQQAQDMQQEYDELDVFGAAAQSDRMLNLATSYLDTDDPEFVEKFERIRDAVLSSTQDVETRDLLEEKFGAYFEEYLKSRDVDISG